MNIASNTSNLSFRAKRGIFPQQSSASTKRSFARPVRYFLRPASFGFSQDRQDRQGKFRMTYGVCCVFFPALLRRESALSLTALLLCVLGFPAVVLAEPMSPQGSQPAMPDIPRSSEVLIALPYFPPEPAGEPGRSKEESGELDNDNDNDNEESIPVMDETVVDGTFEDPFATESEPVYDPWEPFNTNVFTLNYNLDRYALKPVARAYSVVVAPDLQDSFANAFDNLGFASRFLNSIFQGKLDRAGIEMQRFLLNSTLGVGGLFDVAKYMFGIEAPPAEDTGQTLASYGVASGPYMVLPLLPPMTVRDAAGIVGDIFMNPVNYFIPFTPNLGLNAGGRLNDRAVNLETFEGLEESTVDLYGAVRSGYMDRRTKDIEE